jgi:predicted porin
VRSDGPAAGGFKSQSRGLINDRGSRLGFKGTEDLGGGLSAVFQYEVAVDMDGATGFSGSRDTYAGIASKSMGTVMLGYISTPYKGINDKMDIFIDTLGATGGNLHGTSFGGTKTAAGALTGAAQAHNTRGQALAYASPNLNGFEAVLAWMPMGEATANAADANTTNQGSAWSGRVTYANGPLYVGLGHQTMRTAVSNVAAGGSDKGITTKATSLAAMYTFGGAFTVGAHWESVRDDNDPAVPAVGTQSDRNVWSLNGQYAFGNNVVKAQYTRSGDLTGVSNTSAKLWSLGLDHNMSKRTKVYALYSRMDNSSAVGFQLSGGGANGAAITAVQAAGAGAAGADQRGFGVGMVHSF